MFGFFFFAVISIPLICFISWMGRDICRLVTWFYLPISFVMQAGTGIAELIALEISKKVSYMLVCICFITLLIF